MAIVYIPIYITFTYVHCFCDPYSRETSIPLHLYSKISYPSKIPTFYTDYLVDNNILLQHNNTTTPTTT
ncbi:hypothetical protein EYC80_009037 [Monilinia laxa]|uniref:Uncharacterized protein n=1 Tax=Monilinia laxa TaxID=61186 RepID=A0A5N6K274_MONLA|nr:hypothetical protein EYC80_009037 [Monilinia laxa]